MHEITLPSWTNANQELPYVSVIVPALNEEKRIESAIQGLLAQTYPNDHYEIIVVDDGSTDNTREIASKYPIKLISNHNNKGDSASRNIGAKNAKGDIIATTDADDTVDEDWLKNIVICYQEGHPDAVVGSSHVIYDYDNWMEKILIELSIVLRGDTYIKDIYAKNGKLGSNMSVGNNQSFKREVFFKVGGYDMGLKSGMDQDIIWRIEQEGFRVHLSPDAIVYIKLKDSLFNFFRRSHNRSVGSIILYLKHPHKLKLRYIFSIIYLPVLVVLLILSILFSYEIIDYLLTVFLGMPLIFFAIKSLQVRNKLSRDVDIIFIMVIGCASFIVSSLGIFRGILVYILKYRERLMDF